MNHILYQDGILKALPFKRLPWRQGQKVVEDCSPDLQLRTFRHQQLRMAEDLTLTHISLD
jgi:hypothetical protein